MKIRLLNLSLRALTLIVKFAFILSLAFFLPSEQVGLYGLITVTVSYSIYVVGLEFYTFSTRNLVARPHSEWARLLSSQLVFFGVMYAIVLPASSILFWLEVLPWSVIVAFSALVVLEHLSLELMRLLVAIERQLLATMVIFTKQAMWAIFFLCAMWLDPDFRNISDLMIFWVSGTLASILIGVQPLLRLNWKGALEKVEWRWVRDGLMIAFPLLISSAAVRSLFTFDRYVFEALNGLSLLGAYSVYMGVAAAIISFMESGVFVFYYPRMMKAYKLNNMIEVDSVFQEMKKQAYIWLFVLMVGGFLTGFFVFPFLGEPVYTDNLHLFAFIILAVSFIVVGYVSQYGLYATTRDRYITAANLIGLVVAIIAVIILVPFTNYWAVTIGMFAGGGFATIMKAWNWHITRREILKL